MKSAFQLDVDVSSLEKYERILRIMGALSNVFSDSISPYISYRVAENAFCFAFGAKNLSRADASIDASLARFGIGIKTFVEGNGHTFQKIAEFDATRKLYNNLSSEKKIIKIARMRNARIQSSAEIYGTSSNLYHCVTRGKGMIRLFELPMYKIDINQIHDIQKKRSSITFTDNYHEYSFNLSKSTLFQRFITPAETYEIPIEIIENPFPLLENLLRELPQKEKMTECKPHVVLPLYSRSGDIKYVPKKSGLNQWNAKGRPRHEDELYIRIPRDIQRYYPDFFPARNTDFKLRLPNEKVLKAKVCQENDKALMSNPNKELGHWILRDILNIKPGELCEFSDLETANIDSVIIYKYDDQSFEMDFRPLGSYEQYANDVLRS